LRSRRCRRRLRGRWQSARTAAQAQRTQNTYGTQDTQGTQGTHGTHGTHGTQGTHGAHGTHGTEGTQGHRGLREAQRDVLEPWYLASTSGLRDASLPPEPSAKSPPLCTARATSATTHRSDCSSVAHDTVPGHTFGPAAPLILSGAAGC
jgi:hypothetical protein